MDLVFKEVQVLDLVDVAQTLGLGLAKEDIQTVAEGGQKVI